MYHTEINVRDGVKYIDLICEEDSKYNQSLEYDEEVAAILNKVDEFKKKGITLKEELPEAFKDGDALVLGYAKTNPDELKEIEELIDEIKQVYGDKFHSVTYLSHIFRPDTEEEEERNEIHTGALYLTGADAPIKVFTKAKVEDWRTGKIIEVGDMDKLILIATVSNQVSSNDLPRKNLNVTYLDRESGFMKSFTIGMGAYQNIKEAFITIPMDLLPEDEELRTLVEEKKEDCRDAITISRFQAFDSNNRFGEEEWNEPLAPMPEDLTTLTTDDKCKCPQCGSQTYLMKNGQSIYCTYCNQYYFNPLDVDPRSEDDEEEEE